MYQNQVLERISALGAELGKICEETRAVVEQQLEEKDAYGVAFTGRMFRARMLGIVKELHELAGHGDL